VIVGFFAVVGAGLVAFGFAVTGGGVDQDDVALVKQGMGKAYVSGLKGVEQTARRLRGDYCAGEQGQAKDADCG
jgi:hypothetical protein